MIFKVICNFSVLHLQPCGYIVSALDNLEGDFYLENKGKKVNCKSILSLFLQNIKYGETIIFNFNGKDALEASRRIKSIFEKQEKVWRK